MWVTPGNRLRPPCFPSVQTFSSPHHPPSWEGSGADLRALYTPWRVPGTQTEISSRTNLDIWWKTGPYCCGCPTNRMYKWTKINEKCQNHIMGDINKSINCSASNWKGLIASLLLGLRLWKLRPRMFVTESLLHLWDDSRHALPSHTPCLGLMRILWKPSWAPVGESHGIAWIFGSPWKDGL